MKTLLLLAFITVSEAIIVSPVVATSFGWLIFSEVPGNRTIYGGALLLVAGFWLTRKMNRDKEHAPVHPCHTEPGAYQN